MTIVNGQPVNETTFNSGFVSRNSDTDTTGKIDLKNADSDDIIDLQGSYNDHDHNGTNSEKVLATTLDTTGGGADQVLVADGSGSSTWEDQSGGGGAGVGSLSIYGVSQADSVQYTEFTDNTTNASFGEESTNPLSGLKSYKLTNATGAATESVYTPSEDVEERSRGKSNVASLVYSYDGDDGDIKVEIYDVTNSLVLNEVSLDAGTSINMYLDGYVNDTVENIQLRIVIETANSGKELIFDDISFNDEPFTYGTLQEENEFSANIGNNGSTVTITSQGGLNSDGNNAIASITKTDTGKVNIVFTSGFFTVAPSVVLTVTNASDRNISMEGALTTSGFSAWITNSVGAYYDNDFSIQMQRQLADYKQLSEHVMVPAQTGTQVIYHSANSSTFLDSSNAIEFDPTNLTTDGETLINIVDNSGDTRTEFTALEDISIDSVTMSTQFSADNTNLSVYKNDTTIIKVGAGGDAGVYTNIATGFFLKKGEFFTIRGGGAYSGGATYVNIIARPQVAKIMAAIPVARTALFKYNTNNSSIGAAGTGGSTTLPLNTVKGQSWATLSTSQVTLQAGTYNITMNGAIFVYDAYFAGSVGLYDITNSITIEHGTACMMNSTGGATWSSSLSQGSVQELVLTEATTYELRGYTAQAGGAGSVNWGFADSPTSVDNKAELRITKIK